MSAQSNRTGVVRYFEELVNQNRLDLLDEMMTPDIFYHGPINVVKGLTSVKGWLGEWTRAFPDCTYVVEYVVCDDERAMCRAVMRGTHSDAFRGVAATGRRVALPTAFSMQFAADRIRDIEAFYDTRLLFEQLGVALPAALNISRE
ncbi:MAG TPA: ester cyclase [bacterium]|jgi:steroid delta-isomerase-like uncharacterized protein